MRTEWIIILCLAGVATLTIFIQGELLAKHKREKQKIKELADEEIAKTRAECEDEIGHLIKENNAEIERIKAECEKRIRETIEHIESRKEELMEKPNSEVLASVMVALDGYAGRIERIEKQLLHLECISDEKAEEVTSVVNNVNLDIVEKINDMKDDLERTINYSDVTSSVRDISSTVDDISSTVDRICSCVDGGYSSDSLISKIESIESAAEEARDAARDAKDAIEMHS